MFDFMGFCFSIPAFLGVALCAIWVIIVFASIILRFNALIVRGTDEMLYLDFENSQLRARVQTLEQELIRYKRPRDKNGRFRK